MNTDLTERESGWRRVAALAGSLAHELKNPLGTIQLNIQLLAEEWAEPQTAKEKRLSRKLQVLQEEVRRLSQTLEDFLRFVRMDDIDRTPTDINRMMAEVAEFIEPELANVRIRLLQQFTPDLPPCAADARLLKQALLNIILNAQQAMPEGGELILRTARAGEHVQIEIIDTGSGIPEAVQDKVFSPFFSTKSGGTGLGLVITRHVVAQHGGTIRFHSDPGTGTDFIIALPALTQANPVDPK